MYLAPPDSSCLDSKFIDILCVMQHAARWVAAACVHLRAVSWPILLYVWQFLKHLATWERLTELVYTIFVRPAEWPVQAFLASKWFFVTHPHVVHIASFSIFFGPIVILLPLLLFHELVIAVLFNLSFVMHGTLPGAMDDRYLALQSAFDDLKGSIFSSVDGLATKYNKLTTEYWPLVLVRLLSLAIGGLALYSIMSEKQRQSSP
ncbi:hypothetical protein LshimejAT787_0505630 [Lyophyllum shimeji]|uniref:Uncharacterized protein n=1 Tax=Lyophyllum shimeji TaxID=47721 RepID=A0A9P3PMM7_LYOSH|nr:hypothetical protein LshimejAT787_0505630 [Lyophyllum shimeji]